MSKIILDKKYYIELAKHLSQIFATDQSFHAEQQSEGHYLRKSGRTTEALIEKSLKGEITFAIYQRNNDFTIKWICLDFDILKKNLDSHRRFEAENELNTTVINYCEALNEIKIPYLLEYSGRRGYHLWITFQDKIHFKNGFEILNALIDKFQIDHNEDLIGIDKFPSSFTPSSKQGKGVKTPISKNKKSGNFSYFIENHKNLGINKNITELNENDFCEQLNIIKSHSSISLAELEEILDQSFDKENSESINCLRVKKIVISRQYKFAHIRNHWNKNAITKKLVKKLDSGKILSLDDKKTLAGILKCISFDGKNEYGIELLKEVLASLPDYDEEKTNKNIKRISNFSFPAQHMIESLCDGKFEFTLRQDELIQKLIPDIKNIEDGTFDISEVDIDVTRKAELHYIFSNDEVQSRNVINGITTSDTNKIRKNIIEILDNPEKIKFYRHIRNEERKQRYLFSLDESTRLATSIVLKQLSYIFRFKQSHMSYGYRVNRGFKGGYIFQPWLYKWIEFLDSIESFIESKENKNKYIVKIDIRSFYDSIPHDSMKRTMLGGINSKISRSLDMLINRPEYERKIDSLFNITQKIMGTNVGLPQGPAYARYLAELYLDDLDTKIEERIHKGEILFYGRYVDDLFFAVDDREKALEMYSMVKSALNDLSLMINEDKTLIKIIDNFSSDFENYRSQNKYAVDKASKNFEHATSAQQDLAISKLLSLANSERSDDDLSFIFSHLRGVTQVEHIKYEKVISTIDSKLGRGSLYKHIFNFIIESKENWSLLNDIGPLTELQSEALTSCLISHSEHEYFQEPVFSEIITSNLHKLKHTKLTLENLFLLNLYNNINININHIPTEIITDCLSKIETDKNIFISSEIISKINTTLNSINSAAKFIEIFYPLCVSSKIGVREINEAAGTFYSLVLQICKGKQNTSDTNEFTKITAEKYYFLLCLFSTAKIWASTDLLASAWKYCIDILNKYVTPAKINSAWFDNINKIEQNNSIAINIISQIIDGNIVRGIDDKKNIFEKYHNVLLLHILMNHSERISTSKIEQKIHELKNKGTLFKWIIDRENTEFFPNSKKWFEHNLIENGTAILKNNNQVLFRKPTNNFNSDTNYESEINGYAEVVIEYNRENFNSLRHLTEGKDIKFVFSLLTAIIKEYSLKKKYPNILFNENTVDRESLLPFCSELSNESKLIVDDGTNTIKVFDNTSKNFIRSYLSFMSSGNDTLQTYNERIFSNLPAEVDHEKYIEKFSEIIQSIDTGNDEINCDLASIVALYAVLPSIDPYKKINNFLDIYRGKFHKNSVPENKHLYSVNANDVVSDDNPELLLETIKKSIQRTFLEVIYIKDFRLVKDIEKYHSTLVELASQIQNSEREFRLVDFKKYIFRVHSTSYSLSIIDKNIPFDRCLLLNVVSNSIEQLTIKNSYFLDKADQLYCVFVDSVAYIIATPAFLSHMYEDISLNFNFLKNRNEHQNYPALTSEKSSILSLSAFNNALYNIATHQNISSNEARYLLINWLAAFPAEYRQPLASLISGHVCPTPVEIKNFANKVDLLLEENCDNIFFLKEVDDMNGTYRVLISNIKNVRNLPNLSIEKITCEIESATLIVDNIISGSQIIDGLTYYLTGNTPKYDNNYFKIHDHSAVFNIMKSIKRLNIYAIHYCETGIRKIRENLRCILSNDIDVCVLHGRPIDTEAFFGTTENLGASDKFRIREMLKKIELPGIWQHKFDQNNIDAFTKINSSDIDSTDMILRFKSMPKKGFSVFTVPLNGRKDSAPFVRIREKYE